MHIAKNYAALLEQERADGVDIEAYVSGFGSWETANGFQPNEQAENQVSCITWGRGKPSKTKAKAAESPSDSPTESP